LTVSRATPTTPRSYRPRLRTLLTLVAGRSAFRLAQLAATVVLLPLWGERRYGVYAGAVAAFTWVISLLQAGPEKTVLKLLPRAPRTGPQIVEAIAALLWWLPVPLLVAFAVAVTAGERGTVAIYLGVAAIAVGSGETLLLAGLHRVSGRPHYDFRSGFVLCAVQVALIGLVVAGLGPLGYVAAYVVAQAAVNLVLLARLGRPSLRIRERPGFVRRVVWTVLLMGSPEICLYLCTSVLFTILAASRWSGQVGPLFAVLIVWSAGITFLLYGLRVYAPQVSLQLVGRGGHAATARAARLARVVVGVDLAWVAAALVLVHVTGVLGTSRGSGALLVWIVLLASRTPAVAALIVAGFLLENSDARAPRITGAAGPVSLAAVTVAGLLLVPAYGGIGLLAASATGEAMQALVITALVALGRRPVRPSPAYQGSEVAT